MDFINTIEGRTRTGFNDYQKIMIVELSVQAAAQDWLMQSIRPFMSTMTRLEFKEQFLRFFCPSSTRENYRWQLMHLVKGDRSVEEYTYEFLRLGHFAPDVIQDKDRAAELKARFINIVSNEEKGATAIINKRVALLYAILDK